MPKGRGGQKPNGVRRLLLTQLLPPPGSFRVIQGQSSPISLGQGGVGEFRTGLPGRTSLPGIDPGFQDRTRLPREKTRIPRQNQDSQD